MGGVNREVCVGRGSFSIRAVAVQVSQHLPARDQQYATAVISCFSLRSPTWGDAAPPSDLAPSADERSDVDDRVTCRRSPREFLYRTCRQDRWPPQTR